MTIALLTASGTGTRMGQDIPKQFLHIQDKPVIVYTMERFQNSPLIDAIVVVTLPGWIEFVRAYAKQFGITKLKDIVAGGATGQDSIYNGLMAIRAFASDDDVVMVHDGNRTMVDNAIIADSLRVFNEKGNAVAVIPCQEVIFESDNPNEGNNVLKRENVWRTQTPHTFTLGKLLWAHDEAQKRGVAATVASCSLLAQLGETIYFSKGSEKNLKLTTMDDIDIFKALLSAEKSSWQK